MSKKAGFYCALMVLLPEIVRNNEKLARGDKRKLKHILMKYVRSVLFVTVISTVPALLYCF